MATILAIDLGKFKSVVCDGSPAPTDATSSGTDQIKVTYDRLGRQGRKRGTKRCQVPFWRGEEKVSGTFLTVSGRGCRVCRWADLPGSIWRVTRTTS
jgi:hypothetical protein